MKNYLQLELGQDQDGNPMKRGIKLNNRTMQYLSEIEGVGDPIEYLASLKTATDLVDRSTKIIYAGLRSNYYTRKQPEDFTLADVQEWVADESFVFARDVFMAFNAAVNPSGAALGEEGADTRS